MNIHSYITQHLLHGRKVDNTQKDMWCCMHECFQHQGVGMGGRCVPSRAKREAEDKTSDLHSFFHNTRKTFYMYMYEWWLVSRGTTRFQGRGVNLLYRPSPINAFPSLINANTLQHPSMYALSLDSLGHLQACIHINGLICCMPP